jgi:hypothetical protein
MQRNPLVQRNKMLGLLPQRSGLWPDKLVDECTNGEESPSNCEEATPYSLAVKCSIGRY